MSESTAKVKIEVDPQVQAGLATKLGVPVGLVQVVIGVIMVVLGDDSGSGLVATGTVALTAVLFGRQLQAKESIRQVGQPLDVEVHTGSAPTEAADESYGAIGDPDEPYDEPDYNPADETHDLHDGETRR